MLLWAAGESWHLFDTIDVVKYSTGETVHLSLDTMITLNVPGTTFINNEQLPVPGVPMPVLNWTEGAVKYGIIYGTNIGYIYVYHHNYSGVSAEFDAAVLALMGTDGLIIDLRLDWGGAAGLNNGISRLMNHFTSTLDSRKRCSASDLYTICPFTPPWYVGGDIPSDYGTYYDRPIAVLLGPNCLSYGDISSWQFSYIPNVRTFGRSPQAIYSGYYGTVTRPGYTFRSPSVTFVDHYSPNEPRWGEEYPIFDDVWLTPAGVANGEDDVVNRAVEWMNNLVYAHKVAAGKTYYTPEEDTVHITTIIENPNSHQVSVRGYLKTVEGVLIDSVDLVHQLLNPNGEQWMANFNLPTTEDFFDISVTAFDNTQGGQFATPNATRFTTAGPLTVDSIKVYQNSSTLFSLRPYVKNNGNNLTISGAKIRLYCDDPWVLSIGSGYAPFPDIIPGTTQGTSTGIIIRTIDSLFTTGYFNIRTEITVDGFQYWEGNSIQVVVGIENESNKIPTEYLLSQNYPNPFNPTTKISYAIPQNAFVELKVFNLLGQEIATLVNQEKYAGVYEVNYDASNLPSGIYFYRMKAGEYVQTRKMILLK